MNFKTVFPRIKDIRNDLAKSIRGCLMTSIPNTSAQVTASTVNVEDLSPEGVKIVVHFEVILRDTTKTT